MRRGGSGNSSSEEAQVRSVACMHVEQERRGAMQKRAYSSRQKKKWMLHKSFFVPYVLAGHVMWLSITEINRRASEKFIILVEGKISLSK